MDSLFKRYANPFLFVDGMIQTGRFSFFVRSFMQEIHNEKDERTLWEFYLHRVFDKSFDDFKEDLSTDRKNRQMSEFAMETTIKNSMDILKNFKPIEGGEG